MNNNIVAIALAVGSLVACSTQLKVARVDPSTGKLASKYETRKASILVEKKIDLKRFRSMAYFSNGGEYGIEQLRSLNIFDAVLDYRDLQKLVIQEGLQNKVESVNQPLGLNNLAKAYGPFLWIRAKGETRDNTKYLQLIATNTETLEDVFVAEVHWDILDAAFLGGVNDQIVRYPLFNAFLAWSKQNF